ncbi:hypothetical protein NEOLEDRAFT_618453 [Neolentinus lepideus HHB14362 ss-1]|uniref:Uncharacterized protein n=1 Tax=Neolentinus lepideus HHB14362 ss-1 TaxID=1314782 RepID=A0A165QW30_9AGAM|nr:hypothetical protein NEOLEDRAFT_618453 [Neolentinus lepideus HHB14362 ss-1]
MSQTSSDKPIDYNHRYPVNYTGPGGHPTSLKPSSSYRYAKPHEVKHEENNYTTNPHSFSAKSGHSRLDGRRAGITEDPEAGHDRMIPQKTTLGPQKQYDQERKIAECIAKGVDEKGNRKIWSVRDAKAAFVDYRFVNGNGPGSRHALARFVLPTTESDIKDWKTEEEEKAEAEREKAEKEKEKKEEADKKNQEGGSNEEDKQKENTKDNIEEKPDQNDEEKNDDSKQDDDSKEQEDQKEELKPARIPLCLFSASSTL